MLSESFVKGHFQISVLHADGSISEYGEKGNLIVNAFWAAPDLSQVALGVGTGANPPSVLDNQLQSPVGVRISNSGGGWARDSSTRVNNGNFEIVYRNEYTFPLGSIAGNLSELGIFDVTIGGNMRTRSLITPTVTVTAQDQLVVNYFITYYVPIIGNNFDVSFSINGVQTNFTISPKSCNINAWGDYAFGRNMPRSVYMKLSNGYTVNPITGIVSQGTLLYEHTTRSTGAVSGSSSPVNGRIFDFSYSMTLAQGNATFNQIIFSASSSNSVPSTIIILDLGQNIVKSATEVMTITVNSVQKQYIP